MARYGYGVNFIVPSLEIVPVQNNYWQWTNTLQYLFSGISLVKNKRCLPPWYVEFFEPDRKSWTSLNSTLGIFPNVFNISEVIKYLLHFVHEVPSLFPSNQGHIHPTSRDLCNLI